jgi:hypothetical protein
MLRGMKGSAHDLFKARAKTTSERESGVPNMYVLFTMILVLSVLLVVLALELAAQGRARPRVSPAERARTARRLEAARLRVAATGGRRRAGRAAGASNRLNADEAGLLLVYAAGA